ncbi:MAG TPA: hypothetical protein VIK67_03155, partial [Acholeplasma sp.]
QLVVSGIPPEDAPNLAMLAGFYNITPLQMQTAIETAIEGGHPEQIQSNVMTQAITNKALGLAPRYFEVLASIPIFPDGYSVAIMELDPTPPQA